MTLALTPIDYIIIAMFVAAVTFRIVTDIREAMAAQKLANLTYILAKQSFSLSLTVIVPLQSLDHTKRMIQQLEAIDDISISTLIIIDSTLHPSSAGTLRYFLKKHGLIHTKVAVQKQPDFYKIAVRRVKSELVVVLPDTTELHASFYREAILPFGDTTLGSIQLAYNIRPNRTVTSALETLHLAWRHYLGRFSDGTHTTPSTQSPHLTIGTLTRTKHLQQAEPFTLRHTQKTAYSIAPRHPMRNAWTRARDHVTPQDYGTFISLIASCLLVVVTPNNPLLIAGVILAMYIAFGWWSLQTTQLHIAKRIEIILLIPVFGIVLCLTVFAHLVRTAVRYLSQPYHLKATSSVDS